MLPIGDKMNNKEWTPGTWETHINVKLNAYKSAAYPQLGGQKSAVEGSESQCLITSVRVLVSTTLFWSKYLSVLFMGWNTDLIPEGMADCQGVGEWFSKFRFSMLPEFAFSRDHWLSANILQHSHMQCLSFSLCKKGIFAMMVTLQGCWVC